MQEECISPHILVLTIRALSLETQSIGLHVKCIFLSNTHRRKNVHRFCTMPIIYPDVGVGASLNKPWIG